MPIVSERAKDHKRAYDRKRNNDHPRDRRAYTAAYRAANRERIRATIAAWRAGHPAVRRGRVLRQYGLTVEQYDELLASQGGVCAICKGTNTDGRSLSVDHDHRTGANRGLLCNDCNLGLGRAEYIPRNAIAMALYLGSA